VILRVVNDRREGPSERENGDRSGLTVGLVGVLLPGCRFP
jgi:hypothetical protein